MGGLRARTTLEGEALSPAQRCPGPGRVSKMWSASCHRKTLRASPTLARREAAKAASGRTARSEPEGLVARVLAIAREVREKQVRVHRQARVLTCDPPAAVRPHCGALVFGWTFLLRDAIIPYGQIRTEAGACDENRRVRERSRCCAFEDGCGVLQRVHHAVAGARGFRRYAPAALGRAGDRTGHERGRPGRIGPPPGASS